MKTVGPRNVPSSGRAECQQPGKGLSQKAGQILVVCLDPDHCDLIGRWAGPGLVPVSCPLRVLRILDGEPGQRVILDRCPAALVCCRRASVALQRMIRRVARPFRSPLELGQDKESATLVNRVREICDRFRASSQRVTLKDLAVAFGVSRRQLHRLFHAAGFLSPMREVRRLSLLKAYRWLETTNLSIDVIADCLGYFDRANFSRAFFRVFGCYPGSVRARADKHT